MKRKIKVLLMFLIIAAFSTTAISAAVINHNDQWVQLTGSKVKAKDSGSNSMRVAATTGQVTSYTYMVTVYVKQTSNGYVHDWAQSNTVGKSVEAQYWFNTGGTFPAHQHEGYSNRTSR